MLRSSGPAGRRPAAVAGGAASVHRELTARADFSAGLLVKLEAKTVAEVVEVLDLIVTDHNMPNAAGELAERMADVDPYGGLLALGGALFDKIGRLPPR